MNASFLRRTTAYLIDYFVIIGYVAVLVTASPFMPKAWFENPNRAQLTSFLLLTLTVILYFALSEAQMGTVGKRLRNITVITNSGDPASLKQTFVRNTIKFLPWEIAHTFVHHYGVWSNNVLFGGSVFAILLMVVAIGTFFITSEKQALWDVVAKTRVIYTQNKVNQQ